MLALRIRDDLAVTIVAPARDANPGPAGMVAQDRASGLTLVETSATTRPALPIVWSPRDLDQPRYLLASSSTAGEVSLRPAFVDSLRPIAVPQWTGTVWAVPAGVGLAPGTVLFTEGGELVGLVAAHDAGLAVVPARTVLAAAEQLLEMPSRMSADPGIEVDTLTPGLAVAAGTDRGVVVTWVDPSSVAASQLRVGDVIGAVNDAAIVTPGQWRVLAARVSAGDMLSLRITRRGVESTVSLAMPVPAADAAATLGLTLRSVAPGGVEIVRVDSRSAAAAAGLAAGDVITAVGEVTAPTARRVRAAFAAMDSGEVMMVAVTRGASHRVVALQR
jgi:S1-C subfamily serine protease